MSVNDWSIPNYILYGDNCSGDYLNSYKYQINMSNEIAKGHAVTNSANQKLQVDVLKKTLRLNYIQDADARNDDFNSSSNCDFDATRDSFFADNNNNSSSSDSTKGLPGKKSLLDKCFFEGSPDKLMMKALQELNINDRKDFLLAGGPAKTEQFEKEKCAPPQQYHLESSCGNVKGCLTSYQLQLYFGSCHLKDFGLLS